MFKFIDTPVRCEALSSSIHQRETKATGNCIQPVVPLLDFFDESLWVRVPWGKGRAPAFEVATLYIYFHRGVKQSAGEIYICQHVAIEGLAFLGVGSADTSISCRFVTEPQSYKIWKQAWQSGPGRRCEGERRLFNGFASSLWWVIGRERALWSPPKVTSVIGACPDVRR